MLRRRGLRRTAGFVARALAHPCFASLLPFEQAQLGTDPQGRRKALLAARARLAQETVGTREPRKGGAAVTAAGGHKLANPPFQEAR
ncbi:MAG TPA: hypothetical protein VGD19_04085 [Allosphingosinicella sp.]|jgi:hypothetical protein